MKVKPVIPDWLQKRADALFTPEAVARVNAEFMEVINSALPFDQWRPNERFSQKDLDFIRNEVERLTYEPGLPNAGDEEREIIEKLQLAAVDDLLVVGIRGLCRSYAAALTKLLPSRTYIETDSGDVTLPGYYYTRKKVTGKHPLYKALLELRSAAIKEKDGRRRWLAEYLLGGMALPVANFKVRCRYLLRDERGECERLVELRNVKGERNHGPEPGGTHCLEAEAFASPEKFRAWCLSKGNFNFGVGQSAGTLELQNLQHDLSQLSAYQVVNKVDYCGWYDLKREVDGVCQGLWFVDECIFAPNGEVIYPDDDGILWHDGEGYAFMRKKGRESEFAQGRPQLHPSVPTEEVLGRFTEVNDFSEAGTPIGACFREMCQRLEESVGGLDAWMLVGTMLAYAAAPEIFRRPGHFFPGGWVHGQMGSGKTTLVSWMLALQGFSKDAGFSLNSKSVTPVGMSMQLENYSNLALWFDEYRAATVGEEKLAVIRDSYNRQMAVKWTHDGVNRVIRTAPLVSGESTTDDAAARSRYPHVQVSEGRRRVNHLKWFERNKANFFVFFREILRRREEFVKLVMAQMEAWSVSEDTARLPKREMSTHAVPYASFRAAAVMFESHTPAEMSEYHKFMVAHAALSSADVQMDVNVNRFMDSLVTAYLSDELENEYFLVETEKVEHPPESPNQGPWFSHVLYFHPQTVISRLNEWLRKQGQVLALKQRDLRDQLSKHDYWVDLTQHGELKKRIGAPGSRTAMSVWGIRLDKHPMGTRTVPDSRLVAELGEDGFENLRQGMFVTWPNGDPRQGSLHTLAERWKVWHEREVRMRE